jgi:hypothetical protein
MSALVFPVGHYLGPHYPAGAERADEPVGHRVRLGPSLRWLGTRQELMAWTLAHGAEELPGDAPWTRPVLAAHAWQLADIDISDAIDGLIERRLLVEVDPAGEAAAGFAKSHRLRALMLALGRDPDDPGAVLLGTAGQPAVAVSEFGHAVWRAAQQASTLWDACHSIAESDPAVADAAAFLPELLSELHGLLGAGVAYLDAVEGESFDAGVEIH